MRRILLILLSALAVSCAQRPAGAVSETAATADGVEIVLFHTERRCPTCIAMERLTREVADRYFARQLADGTLSIRSLSISENADMADRYEVSWSSLLLISRKDGAESVNDMTRFAFANARTAPERFEKGLKDEIEKMLTER